MVFLCSRYYAARSHKSPPWWFRTKSWSFSVFWGQFVFTTVNVDIISNLLLQSLYSGVLYCLLCIMSLIFYLFCSETPHQDRLFQHLSLLWRMFFVCKLFVWIQWLSTSMVGACQSSQSNAQDINTLIPVKCMYDLDLHLFKQCSKSSETWRIIILVPFSHCFTWNWFF